MCDVRLMAEQSVCFTSYGSVVYNGVKPIGDSSNNFLSFNDFSDVALLFVTSAYVRMTATSFVLLFCVL